MNRCKICVSIGKEDLASAVDAAIRVSSLADVLEIRLDCIHRPSLPVFFSALRCPLLFTNRPEWEGGRYTGTEESRLDVLIEAVRSGTAYVDLELRSPSSSLARMVDETDNSETKLILSYHDFLKTPSTEDLQEIVSRMHECGAEIGKIVTTAHDYHDVLRVLQLQEEWADLNFPLIAFCMGRPGVISRLATLELGGYMTYCAVDAQEATAPGQIAVADMRKICSLLGIEH